jgi:hypothetical protein
LSITNSSTNEDKQKGFKSIHYLEELSFSYFNNLINNRINTVQATKNRTTGKAAVLQAGKA